MRQTGTVNFRKSCVIPGEYVLNKVLFGEAPSRGLLPYPFIRTLSAVLKTVFKEEYITTSERFLDFFTVHKMHVSPLEPFYRRK